MSSMSETHIPFEDMTSCLKHAHTFEEEEEEEEIVSIDMFRGFANKEKCFLVVASRSTHVLQLET